MLDRYSGATIHFVDEKYDSGPILAQRVVPVRADDTPSDLAARVLKEVCFLLISFIQFNSVRIFKQIKIRMSSTHRTLVSSGAQNVHRSSVSIM